MPNAQPEDFHARPDHSGIPPALNQIRAVRLFMQKSGRQTTDQFNVKQASLYIGMMCEELAETLQEVMNGFVGPVDPHSELFQCHQWLKLLSPQLKADQFHGAVLRANREDLLDGMLDTAWVSFGAALSYADDTEGAFREINFRNMDKFRNGAIFDENGKVQKPADWQGPNLTPFVRSKELDK